MGRNVYHVREVATVGRASARGRKQMPGKGKDCAGCGQRLGEGYRFCPNCGTPRPTRPVKASPASVFTPEEILAKEPPPAELSPEPSPKATAEWFWVLGLGLLPFAVSLASGAGLPLSLLVFLVVAALTSHGLKRNNRLVRPASVPTPPVRTRSIPQWVKIAVATRDGGRCRQCGSDYDLQYDHIVPYSRGGSSTDVSNIQLLCGPCNRRKSNRYVG
jgi:hypothetical protein